MLSRINRLGSPALFCALWVGGAPALEAQNPGHMIITGTITGPNNAPIPDAVVEARSRAIREAGGNPFAEYQVPEAAIALKQGFGRLIRSRTDRGILAILDNRITKQRYGQIFFDSLPDYGFTLDREVVEQFFD